MKLASVRFTENLVNFYKTARRLNPVDNNFQGHGRNSIYCTAYIWNIIPYDAFNARPGKTSLHCVSNTPLALQW
jgi:hypothetical protein